MAPRASWKGILKLSLVSIPVRLFNATTQSNRISLNQVHKGCNQRLKMPLTCPTHGIVERDQVAKAYEFEQDKYVIIDQADLDKIKLESNKTIEMTSFVPAKEVDPIYLDSPYYMAPDGPVAEEAFAVVREALKKSGRVGIGRVTMSGRERLVVLAPESKGFRMTTLRNGDEVRAAEPCFDDVPDRQIAADQLSLATKLIESMSGKLDPASFKDRYQESLLAIIKAKIAGEDPVLIQEDEVAKAFSFVDALKASLGGPSSPSAKAEARAPATRKPAAKSVPASGTKGKRKQA
jgi:DNA end-binding protein Ku